MSNPSFEDLMNQKPEEFERPVPMPKGWYRLMVQSYQETVSSQKKTPGLEFTFSYTEAGNDVNQTELDEQKDWQKRKITDTFWFSEKAMYRLREFLEHCGVNGDGRTFKEVLPECSNTPVWAFVQQETSQRGAVYNNIGAYAAEGPQ